MKQKEGDEMSAPMPEDYAYLDQQTDILLTENRMQHERIAALTEQNQQLREALKFYADRDNHEMDGGKRARAALAAPEPKETK